MFFFFLSQRKNIFNHICSQQLIIDIPRAVKIESKTLRQGILSKIISDQISTVPKTIQNPATSVEL